MEKLSIIVPVYNVEKYLKRCVDSILNQTYENTEVILINDGSTDLSGEICDEYKKKYKNVKVIHSENFGQSHARNLGLKTCSGQYVSFIDSDDWILPEMFSFMMSIMKGKNVSIVECDLFNAYSETDITFSFDEKLPRVIIQNSVNTLKRLIPKQRFSVCIRLFEFETIKNQFFKEGKDSPDVYFSFESITKSERIAFVDFPFYIYFYNPESVSKKPYSIKKLDSLEANIFLDSQIRKEYGDKELIRISNFNLLRMLSYHYKYLNYTKSIDRDFTYRKKIKSTIDLNYINNSNYSFDIKVARLLPAKIYTFATKIYRKISETKS